MTIRPTFERLYAEMTTARSPGRQRAMSVTPSRFAPRHARPCPGGPSGLARSGRTLPRRRASSPGGSPEPARCRRRRRAGIRSGLLPPTIHLGGRRRALPDDELEAIAQARAAGCSDDEIRDLVAALVARRTKNRLQILKSLRADEAATSDVAWTQKREPPNEPSGGDRAIGAAPQRAGSQADRGSPLPGVPDVFVAELRPSDEGADDER